MQIFMPWTVIVCILVVAVSPVMARLGLPSQLRLKPTQDEGVSGVDGLVCPRPSHLFASTLVCRKPKDTQYEWAPLQDIVRHLLLHIPSSAIRH